MRLADNPTLIQAVVFDCDGVLVDSETINNKVFAELATEAGVPTTFQESISRFMGRSTVESVADLEATLGHPIGFDFPAVYEHRVLECAADLHAIDGVTDVLDWLDAQGIPVCVASSATPAELDKRLAVTGLARYFGPHLYSASMVRRGKPAPDLFLHAAAQIGIDPAACLLVEDSPYGVRGGRAAGMLVAGFAALATPQTLRLAGADLVVGSMAELRASLG